VTTLRLHLSAAMALFRRDAIVFASYRWRLVTQYVGVLFSLAIFFYISRLVRVDAFPEPGSYFAYAAVGVIILQVLQSTLDVPTTVRQELVAGTFERFLLSPFGPVAGIASTALFPFLLSFAYGIITLVAAVAIFGLHLEWPNALVAVPVAGLGALAFLPFAFCFAAAVVLFKQAVGGAGFVVTGITLIGGFIYPVSVLPGWIQWTSKVQPFTPTLQLLRHLLVGTVVAESPWATAAKVAGFAGVLLPLSLWLLQKSVRVAQRRGTITEY
jgi:ABC-2 type transport system permease protein